MRIIDIELYKLNDNLKNNDTEYKGLTLKFDNKIKKLIYELGVNEDFGARPLKRCIEKEVATPIAMRLLKENTDPDSLITVGVKNKKVSFKINKKPEALFVSDTHKEMATLNTALPK
jgi:ATP-dependent Clp protease ATP-binding subunit ClpA